MKTFRGVLFVLVCVMFALALVACEKKDEEAKEEGGGEATAETSAAHKACENLSEIAQGLDELPPEAKEDAKDMDKCIAEMEKNAAECENGDEVLACIADMKATNMEEFGGGMMGCIGACKEKGGAALPEDPPGADEEPTDDQPADEEPADEEAPPAE